MKKSHNSIEKSDIKDHKYKIEIKNKYGQWVHFTFFGEVNIDEAKYIIQMSRELYNLEYELRPAPLNGAPEITYTLEESVDNCIKVLCK